MFPQKKPNPPNAVHQPDYRDTSVAGGFMPKPTGPAKRPKGVPIIGPSDNDGDEPKPAPTKRPRSIIGKQ